VTERERFAAAMALVDRALDATTGEREAILATCTDDVVRAEARRLLAADAAAGDFLEEPAVVASAVDALVQPSRAGAGDRVGAFELVTLLGRGGMGEVWVAARVGADFEQRVALKLLPVPGDDDAAARFRRERRILARLEHPGIAKLLDGGVTADGRPWLAMELVDGRHLTAHCSELDVDERLQLFVEICDVVQFAHRNLVVHRDLKPSNIIVAADGKPRLLDFGIASYSRPATTRPSSRARANDR
jgi:serine/threonine protein kinase